MSSSKSRRTPSSLDDIVKSIDKVKKAGRKAVLLRSRGVSC